jgi:hypothetical protein
MQKYSFFNSVNGDRKYKAEEWAEYFSSFIGNGIFPNPATNLMVQASVNMTLAIKAGKAWINGYFFYNTTDTTLELDTADGVLKRIDRIVIRWSLTDRAIALVVKKGTNGSSPTPPVLQRDADIYELAIADIAVNNGAVEITQSNITDQRYNSELCGLVTQTVQTIDTSQLAAQLEAWFNEYQTLSREEYQTLIAFFESLKIQGGNEFVALQAWFLNYKTQATTEFTTWFNGLQDILDTNTETHILNLISALTSRVTMLESVIFNDITTNPYLILFDNLDGVVAGGVWNTSLQRIEC